MSDEPMNDCGESQGSAERFRTACTRLLPLLLVLTLPAAVQAQFNYVTNDGTITITGYTGSGGDVAIPDKINGLPVTGIGTNAFRGCDSLTSVTIPTSVTSIGDAAFAWCWRLPSITIPDSVTSIGSGAFSRCDSLTSVTIPNSVTSFGDSAFANCSNLTGVTIGNSVNSIGDSAFAWCQNLASVTIGNSVSTIRNSAFYRCVSLASVNIPDCVTSIGVDAFFRCNGLTSITIPNGVTNIAFNAFAYCTNLTAITVDALNSVYSSVDGVLFNKVQTTLIRYPAGKGGAYTILQSVTSIETYAFHGSFSLTSVTIPNSISSIGSWSFYDCPRLANVTIGNTVTSIEEGAFAYCASLRGAYFYGNTPNVGPYAFTGAVGVTVYYLPGTTGWGQTFGSRPTALWWLPYPVILDLPPSFGVKTNAFGFVISWATNASVVVEACSNLANPAWSPVGTNTLTDGWSYFSDPEWTNYPARFYRLRSP